MDFNLKDIYNAVDSTMGGPGYYAVATQVPDTFDWNWEYNPEYETFFVNFHVTHPAIEQIHGYALLYESKGLIPNVYDHLENNLDKFKMVFTPNSHLVETYPDKCKWVPGGGIWVGAYGGGEIKLHDKSKMISMVSSTKEMNDLHKFRLQLANYLKDNTESVIVTIGSASPSGEDKIYHSLHDYRYSIILENYIDKWYFTEKLMNCFATGTIPIYLGATDLEKYFNTDGVIFINDKSNEEILKIVNSLTPEYYESKMDAIKENFETVQKFRTIEDYMNINYLKG